MLLSNFSQHMTYTHRRSSRHFFWSRVVFMYLVSELWHRESRLQPITLSEHNIPHQQGGSAVRSNPQDQSHVVLTCPRMQL